METVPLLLKITLFSFLSHTPKVVVALLIFSPDLMLKLHGICKQDPVSASISFGAVMNRAESSEQAAEEPVKQTND